MSSPKCPTSASSPGAPGSTTSRARRSVSITGTPSSRKRAAAVDLPLAMPPVRATRSISTVQAEIPADDCVAPKEGDQAGDGEIGAERHGLGAVASLDGDGGDAKHRARRGRKQDHQRQLLPAQPGAERGEQLEVAIAHAFLAGQQLEQLEHGPEAEITGGGANDGVLGRDKDVAEAEQQAEPEQRQGEIIRQQLVVDVDEG